MERPRKSVFSFTGSLPRWPQRPGPAPGSHQREHPGPHRNGPLPYGCQKVNVTFQSPYPKEIGIRNVGQAQNPDTGMWGIGVLSSNLATKPNAHLVLIIKCTIQ